MSTILDALRKVEENQRTRSADARAQLLSSPSRPSAAASRQHRAPWIIGAGLALAGFAAGVGLMFWGPRSHGTEDSQMASATGGDVPSEKSAKPAMPAPAEPTAQPSRPAVAQPLAQARSQVPAEPPAPPASTLAQGEAQAVPQVSRPQSLTPPTESAPLGASPTPQLAMPTLPSPFPPPSAPAERPAVP